MKLMADWLELPPTQKLISIFDKNDAPMRFVGGCVRDAKLGWPVKDIDVATLLHPDAVITMMREADIATVPTGLAHGTVTAIVDGKSFEITTLRKDVACDGRHAEVTFTDNWQEDASRRDFTMNALYLSPTGELYDYFGGLKDMQKGKVRFIGDAMTRITEDRLRILRFFRFHAGYGKGMPDKKALAACVTEASHIGSLSGERIREELLKLLALPQARLTVDIMRRVEILPYVLEFEVGDVKMIDRLREIARIGKLPMESFVLLAAFIFNADCTPEEAVEKIVARLKLSNAMANELRLLVKHESEMRPSLPLAEQKTLLRKLGRKHFELLVAVAWALQEPEIKPKHPYRAMLELAMQWQPPAFILGGDDLMTIGIQPGWKMGDILNRLEREWETNNYRLTKEQLLARARQLK